MMETIRAGQAALRNLPRDVIDVLDRFDPDGDALVIGTFLNEVPEVAGRGCLAWRWPEWIALEDKVVVDDLWDAAGVERVSSRVVPVDDLDIETEVVWAGDARGGFHGGADLTLWIQNEADATAALDRLRKQCDRVRVMPFLEGIPCSIHGFVFADYVAAIRPVEMVTLRRGSAFFYAGAATFWDPPDADREQMRAVARRVGAELRRSVDFRGAFTVDGVMTEAGFRPTELNPRMGAGLRTIARGAGDMPFDLLNQLVGARPDLDYKSLAFEQLVLETADARRSGGTWKALPRAVAEQEARPLAWTGDEWVIPGEASTPDASFEAGPSNVGSFLRLTLEPARTPAGPSVGERAAAFYAFTDTELATGIGALEAALDVRH
jgi:hypothetical protein